MNARDEILRRIRTAVGSSGGPEEPVPREYARSRPLADGLFAERVADYRAVVHRAAPGELGALVAACLERRGARRVCVPADLPREWLAEASGVEFVPDSPPLPTVELDAVDGVVTGCAVAIAETGTIVLDGGAGQGRRALTLVPDYHLCVVRADQIAGTVPEALARLDPRRPLTFVSGPSATSDIELNRVEGVHGPRNLEVVITH
ncbi:lactate utilization protein C [Carbonactinospora thermoautotrophica]|uniref:Lactate utilization protein C n=2 Tax=Carbonactinospora thermoautotrophica TaxID=1469144 RepID=A0A132MJK8_9ACTN|nr:LUD domain-containing protein [Carbonactinospora thermoautotrophica]KWW97945.1 lactate utilization protein C [Carbonactinospora thermoautotrophica]